jgi:protease I
MKTKLAIIIANQGFRDEEYFETKELLEKSGLDIVTFSNKKGLAQGKLGGEVFVDKDLNDLNIQDFQGIIFIGGSGALECLDNELSYLKTKEAYNSNKLVAAICIAPLILFRAGILEKGTVWSSENDKAAVDELGEAYTNQRAVRYKNTITANGPEAIKEFSNNIIDYFNENR